MDSRSNEDTYQGTKHDTANDCDDLTDNNNNNVNGNNDNGINGNEINGKGNVQETEDARATSIVKATQTTPAKSQKKKSSRYGSRATQNRGSITAGTANSTTPPNISKASVCKALTFMSSGTCLDKIAVKDIPLPVPGDNQVRVKMMYAGVNFLDLLKKQGLYPRRVSFPFVSGVEFTGTVDVVGSSVADIKMGDKVMGLKDGGCFQEFVCVEAEHVCVLPDQVTMPDGAAMFVSYVTAYSVLFRLAMLQPRQTILLPQAAGAFGHAVIQLAKTIPDVKIIAMCSKPKHEYMRSLGVAHVVDYKTYVEEVRKICTDGVDLILDSLNFDDSVTFFSLLKPFGRIIHLGVASASGEDKSIFKTILGWWKCLSINSIKMINTNRMIGGYNLNIEMKDNPAQCMETLKIIFSMMKNGVIKPQLDSIFPLAKGKDAFQRLQKRKNIGKILISTQVEDVQILRGTDLAVASTNGSSTD